MAKSKTIISIVLNVITILIALSALVHSCSQSKKMSKLDYQINAVQYSPKLSIDSVGFISHTLKSKKSIKFPKSILEIVSDSIEVTVKMDLNFRVVNVGNSTAKLIFYALTDTISGEDEITKIFNKNYKNKIEKIENEEFYSYTQIIPNDTVNLTISHELATIKDGMFVIHFYLLYQNDLGHLYNTYYWVRFKESGSAFLNSYFDLDTGKLVEFNLTGSTTYTKIDDNPAYHIYSQKEAEKMIEKIGRLSL